jgi:transposase
MVARKHRLPDKPTQAAFTDSERQMLLAPMTHYSPTFANAVIKDLSEGYSLGGFAGRIGVARPTLNKWMAAHPEFGEACARAMAVRQRWWERLAIDVATTGGQGAQGQLVIFGLINAGREDWKQKQEIEHTGQLTLAALVESSMKTVEGQVIEAQAQIVEPDQSPSDAPSEKENDLFG